MSHTSENATLKYRVFNRKQLHRVKIKPDLSHLEKFDSYDTNRKQWFELGNMSSVDHGHASRTSPRIPLVWASHLDLSKGTDGYGTQNIFSLQDILREVNETTWQNLSYAGEIQIAKFNTTIRELNAKKRQEAKEAALEKARIAALPPPVVEEQPKQIPSMQGSLPFITPVRFGDQGNKSTTASASKAKKSTHLKVQKNELRVGSKTKVLKRIAPPK